MELWELTALELAKKIRAREVSAVEAADASLARIEAQEKQIHAFITVDGDGARKRAEQIQRRLDAGEEPGILAGVPCAVKDNLCIKGMRTTCGSKMLENFVPFYTAYAVERLERAGAVVLGKTNMDEFGMGSTTETSAFGVTKNPWNTAHTPGGSSGGSCAAVAAGEAFAALGTDTGGSVRQPAAFCGVTGIKPTYGTVSRYGMVAYGSSLEQVGAVAGDVGSCAAVLEAIASYDKKDSTCLRRTDCDFTAALSEDIRGMKIGIPAEYLGDCGNILQGGTGGAGDYAPECEGAISQDVRTAVSEAAQMLRDAGAVVEEFSLGMTEYVLPAYYTLASAEASSNLARFDGIKYGVRDSAPELSQMYRMSRSQGFGAEVKRRIMLGSFVLSAGYYDAYYLKAMQARTLICRAFDSAFERYEAILAPTAPGTAPRLGKSLKNPMQMYLGDIYTVPANLAGLPAISVPCGTDCTGLPIGVQLIGDRFQEKNIIRAAHALERCLPRRQCPEQCAGLRTETDRGISE